MIDRQNTIAYPNEDAEKLTDIGISFWYSNIDPYGILCVPRRRLDKWLLESKIILNNKEVYHFLAGVLNGTSIKSEDDLKKSDFVRLIIKSVLRETVKKIISFI